MPKPTSKFDHLKKGSVEKSKHSFTHIFDNDEVGGITKMGKRFTDRPAIGKKAAYIVGI